MVDNLNRVYRWLILSMPFFLSSLYFTPLLLRFVAPVFSLGVIFYLLYRSLISFKIAYIIYILLILFLSVDVGLLLFQGTSFDLRFYDMIGIDTIVVGVRQYPLYTVLSITVFSFFLFISYRLLKELDLKPKKNKWALSFLALILLFVLPSSFSFFTNKYIAYSLYKNNLKQNVKLPSIDLKATKGKNLLLIYLESYEQEFVEKEHFPKLAPFLQKLSSKNSVIFENNHMVIGADMTIKGIFTSQCGATYQYKETENLVCLGDILNEAEYKQVFMQAADLEFEDKDIYFSKHKYDEIIGKKVLSPIGDNPNKKNSWGIYDEDLFDYAYDKFLELNNRYIDDGTPYHLSLLTVDTHNGDPSPICPKYNGRFWENHFFQSYHCTDYLLEKFINKIKKEKGSENLIIAILGDHLQNFDMYASKLNKMDRRVFAIINNTINKNKIITQITSHVNFTPTLLAVMDINTNAKFLFGKNALYPIPKSDSLYNKDVNKRYYNALISDSWLGIFGKKKKIQIKDLYSYGTSIKNISLHEIKKYFLPNIDSYKEFSSDEDKIYYSVDDNMLFIKTDKIFETIHLELYTKSGYFFNDSISINKSKKLGDNWYVWVFGNHFKDVDDLIVDIKEIKLDDIFEKPNNIKSIKDNVTLSTYRYSCELFFSDKNPKDKDKIEVVLEYANILNSASFYISDLYKNKDYPNRVKYRVIYNDKIIIEKDLADDDRELITIDFKSDNHDIIIEVEAQKGIEAGWSWGEASKIKVDFKK